MWKVRCLCRKIQQIAYFAVVWFSRHCYRDTLRIWHLSVADRKIRPVDIKMGQTKRSTRFLEVGGSISECAAAIRDSRSLVIALLLLGMSDCSCRNWFRLDQVFLYQVLFYDDVGYTPLIS